MTFYPAAYFPLDQVQPGLLQPWFIGYLGLNLAGRPRKVNALFWDGYPYPQALKWDVAAGIAVGFLISLLVLDYSPPIKIQWNFQKAFGVE